MQPHIWIVNQFANTPEFPGHTRQYEFGKFLTNTGFDVSIFASDYNLTQRCFRKLKPYQIWLQEQTDNLFLNWLYASPYQGNDWRRYLNMLSFTTTFLVRVLFYRKPDLVIGSSPQIIVAFAACLVAKLKGAKFYFEVRDLWPQVLVELGGKSSDSLFIKILDAIETWLYQHSDRVIVLSKGCLSYVKDKGAQNAIWLPNGPDLETFKSDFSTEEAKVHYGIDPERFSLLYAGAHGKANALYTVVKACQFLDQQSPEKFQVILVGDGPEKAALMDLGRDLKCLEFRDPIPKKEIPNLLQSVDAGLLTLEDIPLFKYGVSPNKLYDYYAASKPVVVAVGGLINEEVETYKIGETAYPEKPHELAIAIQTLGERSKAAQLKMGEQAYQLAKTVYSRSQVSESLYDLVKQDLN
mgnify:CR=1 FL=1